MSEPEGPPPTVTAVVTPLCWSERRRGLRLKFSRPARVGSEAKYGRAGTAERAKSRLAGPARARMAVLTFSRPPVAFRPESDGMGRTLLRRSVVRLAVLSA